MDRLTPGSPAYNINDFVEFRGEYNAAAMRQAVRELVRRHEVLRTEFSQNGGQLAQVILPEVQVPLGELDLSALAEEERDLEWSHAVREQGTKGVRFVARSAPPRHRGSLFRA